MDTFEIINQWADAWCAFMGYQILDSACMFIVVGALWLLVRKRVSTQFGYILFLMVLIKLIIPSPISLPSLFLEFKPEIYELKQGERISISWEFENQLPIDQSAPMEGSLTEVPPNHSNIISLSVYLMGVWVLIVLLFLFHLSLVVWKTRFMIFNTIPFNVGLLPIDIESLLDKSGVKCHVRWVTGDWVKSPMAYGYIHPVVVLPKDISENFTPNQIRWIILHELAHIRRGDFWVSLAQRILLALFFFNPLVWWVCLIIDRLREYACDDAALVESQASPKECGEGFLSMVMRANHQPTLTLSSLGMIDYDTLIHNRLIRILSRERILENHLSRRSALTLIGISLFVISFGMRMARAQVMRWTFISNDKDNSPIHRAGECMVYDSDRGVAVLHGGMILGGTITTDTWEFEYPLWKKVSEECPQRAGAGMAYDPLRKVTLLYGGYNQGFSFDKNTYVSSTWEWNGRKWRAVGLEDEPLRAWAAMVYFPELQCVIRHGGIDGSPNDETTSYFSDTRKWDGSRWIQIAEGPKRTAHKMVYDTIRKKVVLYGGMDALRSYPEDTWEFDGVKWEQIATIGPHGRHLHGLAFDESRGVTVLYGGSRWIGYSPNDYWLGDVWEWDGVFWREISNPNPGKALSPEMVYDSQRNKILMYLPSGRGTGQSVAYGEQPTLESLHETWEYGAEEPSGIKWPFGG